jgi:regulatory protein
MLVFVGFLDMRPMLIITALKPHKTRPGRVKIEIDGKYAFELSRKVIRNKSVYEGERLSAERRRELEGIAAREAAIGLLARRERSRAELLTALKRKGFDTKLIDGVLDTLEKEKLQSDSRFANAWVETRRRLSPRGRKALVYELKQKGIAESKIDPALRNYDSDAELAALRDLIEARLPRLIASGDERDKIKRRLLGFLSRRGFSYEDIRQVLARDFPDWA